MVHGEKEPQGSEKRQESKLVLGIPKPGPALGGKRFFYTLTVLTWSPSVWCSGLASLPRGPPHCSRSEPSKMQIRTSCYPSPEPYSPHCPGHKIQTLSRGSQSSRQDLFHPLSSRTSSPAPPPHSLLQPLASCLIYKQSQHPWPPILASAFTHIYTLSLGHFFPPHSCLNNFYSPSFTSWFTCHLLWEGLLESSPSRQV